MLFAKKALKVVSLFLLAFLYLWLFYRWDFVRLLGYNPNGNTGSVSDSLNEYNPNENPSLVFDSLNEYRKGKGVSILQVDRETCKIAERYASEGIDKLSLKNEENYIDLCSSCTSIAAAQGLDYLTASSLMNAWLANEGIKDNIESGLFKFGCVKSSGNRVVFIFSNKHSDVLSEQDFVSPTSNEAKIECWGPDGNLSLKTQKQCDEFNQAWGTNTPSFNYPQQPTQNHTSQSCNLVRIDCYREGTGTFEEVSGCSYEEANQSCDRHKQIHSTFDACMADKQVDYDNCNNPCDSKHEEDKYMCNWAYTYLYGDPGIELNPTKHEECLDESSEIWNSCRDICLNTYLETNCN